VKETTEVLFRPDMPQSVIPPAEETPPIWFSGSATIPNGAEIPQELLDIQRQWKEKADAHGDVGSSVLGAGFLFRYRGRRYEMPPSTRCQGSVSWEHYRDEIQGMLEAAGATDITYNWGWMD